jgi:hypothetical protein
MKKMITLALYVIAFRVVDKIGEYKQRKVKENGSTNRKTNNENKGKTRAVHR